MLYLAQALIWGLSVFAVLCSICTIRNLFVYKYRMDLINKITTANLRDVMNGKPYTVERWDVYESVSYNEMVLKFWRRFSSFYPKGFVE